MPARFVSLQHCQSSGCSSSRRVSRKKSAGGVFEADSSLWELAGQMAQSILSLCVTQGSDNREEIKRQ
ncbi:unnamed protein product [Protopolystoma xenopodis]|uniref:Uncharacterized protein n=1 Tax=Protopolystoma xenopodis TaxID=117903 RepID=A0A448W9U6_9PLAT|nr:unnamed protein product [Protopolystoma xenopodis]